MSETYAASPITVRTASAASNYWTLLRWNSASIGPMLPLVIVIQAMLAAGIIVGFGLLIPDIDQATALFLSTGAPTILLLTLGLVMVPQGVGRARTDGTFEYFRALPVPRALVFFADLTLWVLVAIPSLAAALGVAILRFGVTFTFNWPLLLAGMLLLTVMAASVGYAIAVSVAPMVAQSITQVLVFFVMLFSPIAFPASQLPQWYQRLHDFLPVAPGADMIRAGLDSETFSVSGQDFLVVAAWALLGLAVSIRALVRRG